jgi:hypothetical protein
MPNTSTLITFEGLLIFHKDTSNLYEVGILDTKLLPHLPEHVFQITVTPDPHTGVGQWTLGPADLSPFLQAGNSWTLEVVDPHGDLQTGVQADESLPNRHNANPDNRLGWIVNLEGPEFPNGSLTREIGKLKPIIHLTKGNLFTYCKTGGVNLMKNESLFIENFGFLAGVIAIKIDTSAMEEVVLRVGGGTEIFRLPKGLSYTVSITNSTLKPSIVSHFHAYYELLYPNATDRFDFQAFGGPSPDNPCPLDEQLEETARSGRRVPPPYKCGGTGSNPGGPPLG